MRKTLLAAILLTGWLQAAPPGAAMVTAVSEGGARGRRAAPLRSLNEGGARGRRATPKLQLFDSVQAGQRLQVPAGSRVSFSFLEGGVRVHCTGPVHLEVTKNGVRKLAGTGSVLVHRPKLGMARVPGVRFDWDRMAGVKREDLGWRQDPTQLQPEVKLSWEVPADLEEVEVVIEELPQRTRVLRQVQPAGTSPLTVQLKPGREYALSLRGFGPRRTVEAAEQKLLVLDQTTAARVREAESQARQDGSPEALVELCGYLIQMGLPSRAAMLAQALLLRYPDQPRLKELAAP